LNQGRARSPPSPGIRGKSEGKTLDIIPLATVDSNKTPLLEEQDELDEDDPEAKARKLVYERIVEVRARERALKLNYSQREEFDF
jgi:hypothetical protein